MEKTPQKNFDLECSHCFARYTFDEMMKLEKKPANPHLSIKSAGYVPFCSKCHKPFHIGKWCHQEKIYKNNLSQLKSDSTPQPHIFLSTVHLEFKHIGGMYEIMYFIRDSKDRLVKSKGYGRFYNKQDALEAHENVKKQLLTERTELLKQKNLRNRE